VEGTSTEITRRLVLVPTQIFSDNRAVAGSRWRVSRLGGASNLNSGGFSSPSLARRTTANLIGTVSCVVARGI
jgi:hypothetical protein